MNPKKKLRTFRDVFKFYKKRDRQLDLSSLVDFNLLEKYQDIVKQLKVSRNNPSCNWETTFGMKDPSDWDVYEFLERPGLIIIRNPFLASGQRYWIARCLRDFPKKPNKLNIGSNILSDPEKEWWELCQSLKLKNSRHGETIQTMLRWITFGYHHNWDIKEYNESFKSEFPLDLKILCEAVADVLNLKHFSAEAAIINFYHHDSFLCGHTDHSEPNLEAPLLSFSFGQSAIFLIGGQHIEVEPTPILLESGDIIIMSKESRLCYHGVPRILVCQEKPWNSIFCENLKKDFNSEILIKDVCMSIFDDNFWLPFNDYVCKSRINMNVRQVLNDGQKSLLDVVSTST